MKDKIIYWITTGLISALMLFSGYSYFTSQQAIEGFARIGFPNFFRIELGIAKIIAGIVIILPMIPMRFKQFAYFGLVITFISAFIAHISAGDPISIAVTPLIFLVVLIISYLYALKLDGETHAA